MTQRQSYPANPGEPPSGPTAWSGPASPLQHHPAVPAQGYGVPPRFAPPQTGPRLAEFGDRLVAYLIDYAILSGVAFVLMIPAMIAMFTFMSNAFPTSPDGTVAPPDPFAFFGAFLGIWAGVIALVLLASYIYRVEMMFRTGQTVGKRVMKLRVVPLDPAQRLTRGIAARRWLVQDVAAAVIPFLVYLDGLWQLWDQPYRQCLHDKFAQTVVLKVAT